MPNEHAGHRERVRDRVRTEGLDHFQDYQVLEYALTFCIPYKDTSPLARKLISKFGSFSGVLEADEEDLKLVPGVGDATAHFLANILKIYHYYEQDKARKVTSVTNTKQIYEFAKSFLKGKLTEELYLICLTPKNKIVSVDKISEGSSTEASIQMRLITDKMSRLKVSNIIVTHNHPHGNSLPSIEDNKFTKALVTTLAINGCHLLDHIIIGDDNDYFSYARMDLIEKYKLEVADMLDKHSVAQPRAKYEVTHD